MIFGWSVSDNATLDIARVASTPVPASTTIDSYFQGSVTVTTGGTLNLGTSLAGEAQLPRSDRGRPEIGSSSAGGVTWQMPAPRIHRHGSGMT